MQPTGSILSSFIPQLPVLIVMLAGILIALVRWRKHPSVSLLALLALVLLLLVLVINTLNGEGFALLLHTRLGMDFNRIGLIQMVANLVVAVLRTLAWILLITAIFVRRPEPA